ncbi:hypothetical protein WA026_003612 [Henosepilachna vigintioctopunctata]|uniref:Uncharacterized protein n=1 Tax=Henosepilachna vigintioctopunctata TaxID=420089 RepID=A0AAW1THR0_9CUCU
MQAFNRIQPVPVLRDPTRCLSGDSEGGECRSLGPKLWWVALVRLCGALVCVICDSDAGDFRPKTFMTIELTSSFLPLPEIA